MALMPISRDWIKLVLSSMLSNTQVCLAKRVTKRSKTKCTLSSLFRNFSKIPFSAIRYILSMSFELVDTDYLDYVHNPSILSRPCTSNLQRLVDSVASKVNTKAKVWTISRNSRSYFVSFLCFSLRLDTCFNSKSFQFRRFWLTFRPPFGRPTRKPANFAARISQWSEESTIADAGLWCDCLIWSLFDLFHAHSDFAT